MKKGQIYGQIFIYVLTVVLVAVILVYGYNSIHNFKERAEQISCIKFRNDLQNAVNSLSSDFGTVKIKEFQLCSGYSQICFVETHDVPSVPSNADPIIKDSINSNSGKNVFLVDTLAKESFYIGKISVVPDIFCISSTNNKAILKLEAKGSHVVISRP